MSHACLEERTERAGGFLRRADRRTQIHHRLGIVAGTRLRRHCLLARADGFLDGRQRRVDGKEARDHPLDIAVNHGSRSVEGNRRDRRRRVVADARQPLQLRRGLREAPAVLAHQRLHAGMEVARTGVVAKAGPSLHDLVARSVGERRHVRPAGDEGIEIGLHRRDRRLLQHDLGEPHPIGIGPDAARPFGRPEAPGQLARMAVVPGKERSGDGHGALASGKANRRSMPMAARKASSWLATSRAPSKSASAASMAAIESRSRWLVGSSSMRS